MFVEGRGGGESGGVGGGRGEWGGGGKEGGAAIFGKSQQRKVRMRAHISLVLE